MPIDALVSKFQNSGRPGRLETAMPFTDESIKRYLEDLGRPWSQYVLLDSKQTAVRGIDGSLSSVCIEDDELHEAVKSFLLRMNQVQRICGGSPS